MRLSFIVVVLALVGCAHRQAAPEQLPALTHDGALLAVPVVRQLGYMEVNEPAAPQPERTVRNLCEPVDSRRPYPTPDEKEQMIAVIHATCAAMGVDEHSCLYFSKIVALRESSYRSWVRHKLAGDVMAAASGYVSMALRYGWYVEWSAKDRKARRLERIRLEPVAGRPQNPYYVEIERWLTGGLGLGGLNIAYHLPKIDRQAPPEILCDPVLNVMAQIVTARNAVDRYGARSWYEVQAVYAGRTYRDHNGQVRPLSCWNGCPKGLSEEQKSEAHRGDKMMRDRCRARAFDCKSRPKLGTVLSGRNVTPAQRYELAEKVRGEPLPPFGEPVPTVDVGMPVQ